MSSKSGFFSNMVDSMRVRKRSVFKTGIVMTIAIFATYLIALAVIGHSHL